MLVLDYEALYLGQLLLRHFKDHLIKVWLGSVAWFRTNRVLPVEHFDDRRMIFTLLDLLFHLSKRAVQLIEIVVPDRLIGYSFNRT